MYKVTYPKKPVPDKSFFSSYSSDEALSQEKLNLLFEQETQSLYCKEFGDFIYEIKPSSYKNLIINGMKNIKTFFKNRFVLTV